MKILVVDDDPSMLHLLLCILKRNGGYETFGAPSGQIALDNALSMKAVDLLITDVVMDPMDGFALRAKLEESYPAMKTIFISGYDMSDYEEQTAGCEVLQKPFESEKLLESVAKIELLWLRAAAAQGETPVAAKPAAPVLAKPVPVQLAKPVPVQLARPVPVQLAKPIPVALEEPLEPEASAPGEIPSEEPEITPEELPPVDKIGNFNLIRKIGESEWGPVYLANQTSMARPVAIEVLSNEIEQTNPEAAQRFLALAQAKATVKHPSIISVYEAGNADGHTYYTSEYINGCHLAELIERGGMVDDEVTLRILKVVAAGLSYLDQCNIPHTSLNARQIFLGGNNEPHLSNPATLEGEGNANACADMVTLATTIAALLPDRSASDTELHTLLFWMSKGEDGGFFAWDSLLEEISKLEPRITSTDALKITAQEQAAIRAMEKKQQRRKFSLLELVGCGLVVAFVLALFLYWILKR